MVVKSGYKSVAKNKENLNGLTCSNCCSNCRRSASLAAAALWAAVSLAANVAAVLLRE